MRLLLLCIAVALGHVHHGDHKHDHGHGHGHGHHHHHPAEGKAVNKAPETQPGIDLLNHSNSYFSELNTLVKGTSPLVATVVSSVLTTSASIVIFGFIRIIKRNRLLTNDLLNTLISFSCGALIGDVFLHLLPSIEQNRNSSLLIILGILGFYVLDRTLSHEHKHIHENENEEEEEGKEQASKKGKKSGKSDKNKQVEGKDIKGNKEGVSDEHREESDQSAILLFLADFLHNVTDGMAIGASYVLGPTLGLSTTIAIFLHEIAHEIGDFIAFLKFGMSLKGSLYMNLATGLGSLIGGIAIVVLGTHEALKVWVLPVVVGNFLYVSLVSMLSTMRTKDKGTIIWEVIFFATGVGLMVLIEELE